MISRWEDAVTVGVAQTLKASTMLAKIVVIVSTALMIATSAGVAIADVPVPVPVPTPSGRGSGTESLPLVGGCCPTPDSPHVWYVMVSECGQDFRMVGATTTIPRPPPGVDSCGTHSNGQITLLEGPQHAKDG